MRAEPSIRLAATAAAAAVAAFALDLALDPDYPVAFVQVAVMLLGLRLERRFSLGLALLCSLAIVLGHLLTPAATDETAEIAGRTLAVALVWLIAAQSLIQRRSNAAGDGPFPIGDPGRFALPTDPAGPAALSEEARRILRLPPQGPLTGHQILARIHHEDRERAEAVLRQAAEGDRVQFEFRVEGEPIRHVRATGQWMAHPVGDRQQIAGTLMDLTELKRAELALHEQEARLRSILETAPEAIITINDQGIVESFSASAEKLFGYDQDEVIGRNVSMLMPAPYAAEHDGYLERYRTTGERRIIGLGRIVDGLRKDGTVFPMELAVGEVAAGSERMFTGFIRDLTARQRMEQELRQSQKMEAVGQLTGGVAHDFNNLLTVIIGNLEMVQDRIGPEQGKLSTWLDEANQAAESGAQLTARLLAFARRQPLNPHVTDLAELVTRSCELLGRTLGESIEIKTVIDPHPCQAMVDPSQLQNALLNVAINARDAMPGGGRLTIDLTNAQIDEHYAGMQADLPAGRYAVIAVTDTGSGMPPDVRDRAFEPFFTTKPTGAGTGLGLSMVYGFVKQTGGHVQIYSEPGRGTTVRMYLPQIDENRGASARAAKPTVGSFTGRGETVLVVEDDARVRRVTAERLRELGYRVVEAADGPSALDILGTDGTIDLLLTDMVMPGGMNGAELADAARAARPSIHVLLTSGYAEPDLISHGLLDRVRWLRKPHSALDLARTVREVIDG